MEVGYFKRWLQNFTATDNLNLSSADFTPFTINAPSDSRLPNGGGYTVGTLYNVTPAGFLLAASNNITDAGRFGTQYSSYNGMLFNISARASHGLTFQGGINSGKTVTDNCEIRAQLPELQPTNAFCHNDPGLITKMSAVGSYVVPKIDVLFAGTLRSDQGAVLAANWNAPTATVINPALGRTISGGATTLNLNILPPGAVWGDRVNEIDLRFAKILRFGRTRTNVGIDVYNILNSNAILQYNQTFTPGGAWLAPQAVLTPRFLKISAQIDF